MSILHAKEGVTIASDSRGMRTYFREELGLQEYGDISATPELTTLLSVATQSFSELVEHNVQALSGELSAQLQAFIFQLQWVTEADAERRSTAANRQAFGEAVLLDAVEYQHQIQGQEAADAWVTGEYSRYAYEQWLTFYDLISQAIREIDAQDQQLAAKYQKTQSVHQAVARVADSGNAQVSQDKWGTNNRLHQRSETLVQQRIELREVQLLLEEIRSDLSGYVGIFGSLRAPEVAALDTSKAIAVVAEPLEVFSDN